MEENWFNKLIKAGLAMDLLSLVVTCDFMVPLRSSSLLPGERWVCLDAVGHLQRECPQETKLSAAFAQRGNASVMAQAGQMMALA